MINQNAWGKTEIEAHREKMIERFLQTFPLSDEFKNAQNWVGKKEIDYKEFSPLDDEIPDLEYTHPALIKIYGNAISVKTWQEVFLEFINFIRKKSSNDFQFLLENQNKVLSFVNGMVCIVKWPQLKKMIEEDENLGTRYKTFDGIFYDKVENLSDDIFFVHTNISAMTCIRRISNVMNKFNMERDSVLIGLK